MHTLSEDIVETARLARRVLLEYEPSTCGHCFDASFGLAILLAEMDIDVRLVKGTYDGVAHFWIETLSGWYLDVTADQFGGPQIVWDHRDNLPEFRKESHLGYNFRTIAAVAGAFGNSFK